MAQAPQSSIFSRKIINLFAGMAYGSPDLPRFLVDAKYVCHAIEPCFAVAPKKLVNPELVLCSDIGGHTLIIEAKSGANLKPDQLARYALIGSDALVKQAFVAQAAASSHDVLIIGLEEHEERLVKGSATTPSLRRVLALTVGLALKTEGTPLSESAPVSAVQSGIKRIQNEFGIKVLNEAFNPTLSVDWDLVPVNFLPVDHESENWEFASFIFPEVIAAILEGRTTILVDDLAKTFIKNWDFIAAPYKKQLLERIRDVLKIAAQKRFSLFMNFGLKGASKSQITLLVPENLDESVSIVRSQLQRRFKDLMNDLDSPQIAIIYED